MITPEKLASILLENGWKDTADAQHTKLQTEIIPAIQFEVKVFAIYEEGEVEENFGDTHKIRNYLGFCFSEIYAKTISEKYNNNKSTFNWEWKYEQLKTIDFPSGLIK